MLQTSVLQMEYPGCTDVLYKSSFPANCMFKLFHAPGCRQFGPVLISTIVMDGSDDHLARFSLYRWYLGLDAPCAHHHI